MSYYLRKNVIELGLKNRYTKSRDKNIALSREDILKELNTGTVIKVTPFPDGIIRFYIDPKFNEERKRLIRAAAKDWQNAVPALKLIEQNKKSTKYIYIKKVNTGCRTNGLGASITEMQLSDTCDYLSILHEFGHVVGLEHEHVLTDRNDYITLNTDAFLYIQNNFPDLLYKAIGNYIISKPSYRNPFSFSQESIMLYTSYPRNAIALRDALKREKLPLYTFKDGSDVERQAPDNSLPNKFKISQKDINLATFLYKKNNDLNSKDRFIYINNIDYSNLEVYIHTAHSNEIIDLPIGLNSGSVIALQIKANGNVYYEGNHVREVFFKYNRGKRSIENDSRLIFNASNILFSPNRRDVDAPLVLNYKSKPVTRETVCLKGFSSYGGKNGRVISKFQNNSIYINLHKWETPSRKINPEKLINYKSNRYDSNGFITFANEYNSKNIKNVRVGLNSTTDYYFNFNYDVSFNLKNRCLYMSRLDWYNWHYVNQLDLGKSNDVYGGDEFNLGYYLNIFSYGIEYRPNDDFNESFPIIDYETGYYSSMIDVNGIHGNTKPAYVHVMPENNGALVRIKVAIE